MKEIAAMAMSILTENPNAILKNAVSVTVMLHDFMI